MPPSPTASLRPPPPERPPQGHGAPARDFSAVTSVEAAQGLVEQGVLLPAPLFPAELGGREQPGNLVYLPREVAEELGRTAASVLRKVGRRWASTVDVVPERKGQSVVPARILIRAGLVTAGNAFGWTIEVW